MNKRQFRVLYREFLFRVVDRELLSSSAQGDTNKLLGRFAAILIWLSIPFAIMALGVGGGHMPHQAVLISGWSTEHLLIATTMLVIGLFAVLSWNSTFPDRRDVLVLAPLPVRASTIFLAKLASLAAALSLTVITFNAGPGLTLPFALAQPTSSLLDMIVSPYFYRAFAVYWITMLAAGTFVLCCVLTIQGIAAQLPRRIFLRVSSLLQMIAMCLFVGMYFLQPSLATEKALLIPENHRLLAWLPSYWFFALFQQLNGSMHPALSPLVMRAWIGLAFAGCATAAAYLLSYFRTLRKIVEEPDIVPGTRRLKCLPRFGNSLETAVVQFSIRSLFRSRHHRVILAFYLGIGFAISILFLKTPFAQRLSAASASDLWHQVSVPLLASSFVMLCFWTLGIRVVLAMPLELPANWIFRLTQLRPSSQYQSANRRAMFVLALAPVWAASAVLFLSLWPWRQAAGHLAVLALLGITLVELCLHRFRKIPFACSYLPGKSNLHITFCLCLMLGLNLVYWSAEFERRALFEPVKYTSLFALLGIAAICAKWRTTTEAKSQAAALQFEDTPDPAILPFGLHPDGAFPISAPY